MTNAEAWFSIALRPRKPEGSLGRTAQDCHLDSHTAPELRPSKCSLACRDKRAARAATEENTLSLQSSRPSAGPRNGRHLCFPGPYKYNFLDLNNGGGGGGGGGVEGGGDSSVVRTPDS